MCGIWYLIYGLDREVLECKKRKQCRVEYSTGKGIPQNLQQRKCYNTEQRIGMIY